MRIGLFAPLVNPFHTPDYIVALGRGAEARGFHSLWLGEHVVLFDSYGSAYPYAEDDRLPLPAESGLLEPFTTLSYLAAATKRIRLGTGICLVPQRNPVYTAKEVATLDYLSGGRVDFGVGVGWLKEEFDALGVPFARRGARTREYLEVMRRLWHNPVAAFSGEFYQLPPCRQDPKPAQQPHPPIHIGGESDAALARVADLGQGWFGFNRSPAQAKEDITRLGSALESRGRALHDVEITISPYTHQVDVEAIARYRDAGVDQLLPMATCSGIDKLEPLLDRLAEQYPASD